MYEGDGEPSPGASGAETRWEVDRGVRVTEAARTRSSPSTVTSFPVRRRDRVVEQVEFVAALEDKAATVDHCRPLENVGAGRIVAREAGDVGGPQPRSRGWRGRCRKVRTPSCLPP